MTPQQIDRMSMWQFWAVLSGAVEGQEGLTAEEADDLWDWLKAS